MGDRDEAFDNQQHQSLVDRAELKKIAQRPVLEKKRARLMSELAVLEVTGPGKEVELRSEAEFRKTEKKLRQIAALEAKGLGELDGDQLRKVGQRRELEKRLARLRP